MNASELLTVDQLAQRLGVAKRTVQVWTRNGKLPSVRISPKVIRFEWEVVVAKLRNLEAANA